VGVFGRIVVGHRRRLGLTQEELADRSGLSVRAIRNVESGRIAAPRAASVRLLADAFGLTGAERTRFHLQAAGPSAAPAVGAAPGRTTPAQRPPDLPHSVVPALLPLAVLGFTGRREHLARLDALADTAETESTAVVICAISGTAGAGKTALAVHWAHLAAGRFPDGHLYANLRGFDAAGAPVPPASVARGFLDALGVPAERLPADPEAQIAAYRSAVAGRRMLIVLDNARDPDQVRPLLPGSPGCLVLITSRSDLNGLVAAHGARPLAVDLLPVPEARQLLAARLGPDRVEAEPEAVDEIIFRCARLPLALAVVAARAAAHPDFPLATLAKELRGGLPALEHGDESTDVRGVLSWSYRTLSPPAARLFRLVGLHPGPDLAVGAAASLAGCSREQGAALLAELTRGHLIAEHLPGRFALHDLLRAYAADLAHRHYGAGDRHAAHRRMLDHYLHTTHAAALLLNRHRDPIPLDPIAPGVTTVDLDSRAAAVRWFTTERHVLVAASQWAVAAGFGSHVGRLAWSLVDFLDQHGYWPDQTAVQRAALRAAQDRDDPRGQAHPHRVLALVSARTGRYDDAYVHYRRALDIYVALDDRTAQAHTHLNLSEVFERQDRRADALRHAQQALELFRAADHPAGQARALNMVGWCHTELGDGAHAVACCERSIELHRRIGDRCGEAAAWDTLGYTHHRLGDHARAIDCLRRALQVQQECGHRFGNAEILHHLGDAQFAGGAPAEARRAWAQALEIFTELGHPEADRLRDKLAAAG
jgi:transcriptional regulator with XRE-family HTH domain